MISINIKKEKIFFQLRFTHMEIIWMECKKLGMASPALSTLLSAISFDYIFIYNLIFIKTFFYLKIIGIFVFFGV